MRSTAPQGLRVKTVWPGPVRTAMWEASDGRGARLAESLGVAHAELLNALPGHGGMATARPVEPEEVAQLITFLANPRADSVTGSGHLIDAAP